MFNLDTYARPHDWPATEPPASAPQRNQTACLSCCPGSRASQPLIGDRQTANLTRLYILVHGNDLRFSSTSNHYLLVPLAIEPVTMRRGGLDEELMVELREKTAAYQVL